MVALPHKCESPSLLYIILIFYMYKIITMTQFLYYIFFRRNYFIPTKQQQYWSTDKTRITQPSCNGENHHISSIAFRHHIIHFFFFNLLFFNLLLRVRSTHSPQSLGGDNAFLLLPLRRIYYLNFLRGIFRERNL